MRGILVDVFISYSRSDVDRVAAIARLLESAGISVWWDRHLDIDPTPFAQQIAASLDAAKAVLVVWSAGAVSSHWVWDEAERARRAGKYFGIAIDRSPLPPPFGAFETGDFVKWQGNPTEREAQRLVSSLSRAIEGRASTRPTSVGTKPVEDQVVWAVGGAGAGKTVTLSNILRFLDQASKFISVVEAANYRPVLSANTTLEQPPAIIETEGDLYRYEQNEEIDAQQFLYKSWQDDWRSNRFHESTAAGPPLEISSYVSSVKRRAKPKSIRFVECSGEFFRDFADIQNQAPTLIPELNRYLEEGGANLTILLCFNCATAGHRTANHHREAGDLVLSRFLTYAAARIFALGHADFRAALLLCNPWAVDGKVQSTRHKHGLNARKYVKRYLPRTFALLQQRRYSDIRAFSIGRPTRVQWDDPPHYESDLSDAERLFRWIYETK